MPELHVRLAADGTILAVPCSLDAMTTYVLLEQEGWFEKEVDFVRRYMKPGMTAVDIGANLGVYSVPMARSVGPEGMVYSYEPASETRSFLNRSAQLNQCANLCIIPAAVSNREGEALLALSASSELNRLTEGGAGERVRLTSLDVEDAAVGWRSPDFIKIDAEGEEERILQGGSGFFARHSPLVMFEIKSGSDIDRNLPQKFQQMGYGLYRALAGEPILVPFALTEPVDNFELNLFAAKADRVAQLASAGLLIEQVPAWVPDAEALSRMMPSIGRQGYGAMFVARFGGGASVDPGYRDCLAAYGTWRTPEVPLADRYAALRFAIDRLDVLCRKAASLPRLSTLGRAAWDAGQRDMCLKTLSGLVDLFRKGDTRMNEPFWPASARFDNVDPSSDIGNWFFCAVAEQIERSSSHSTVFRPSAMDLDQLTRNPFVSAEMVRRRVLQLARKGDAPRVPSRLLTPAADHANAEVWREGRVPGVVV